MQIRHSVPSVLVVCLIGGWCIAEEPVAVRWLDDTAPTLTTGVSWGVPWTPGTIQKDQAFSLSTGEGETLPVQIWPHGHGKQ